MNILRLLYLNRVHALFCMSLILSFSLYFSNTSGAVLAVKADLADILSIVLKPQEAYRGIMQTREKNYILQETVSQLRLLNTNLIHLKYENEKLRSMLNYTQDSPLSLKSALVVNNHLSDPIHTLTINSGRDVSLEKGMPVIDMDGVLGKIIAVGDKASTVQLITDRNFRMSVRVGERWNLGLFVPTHGLFGIVEGIPKSQKVVPGDLIITSGISDIYPSELPVGEVVDVKNDSERPFLQVIAEISSNPKNSDYVFIIQ